MLLILGVLERTLSYLVRTVNIVYFSELFPTSVRSIGIGLMSAFGFLGLNNLNMNFLINLNIIGDIIGTAFFSKSDYIFLIVYSITAGITLLL